MITQETLDGQSVGVFTECSSGQRYALDADMRWLPVEFISTGERPDRQIEVRGTLPERTNNKRTRGICRRAWSVDKYPSFSKDAFL